MPSIVVAVSADLRSVCIQCSISDVGSPAWAEGMSESTIMTVYVPSIFSEVPTVGGHADSKEG